MLLSFAAAFAGKKYENPITKDTQQPDKVLFDKAINDIEHGRYELARLTLQTLINTYDTSEYLAKAKLAIADSWFREGGAHGLAQAEAEYKDFILFYPTMEEAAEAQEKVCDIQYKQMEKADRDPMHALRAEDECQQLLLQFPNSKFAPRGAADAAQHPGSAGRQASSRWASSITTRAASRPRPTACRRWWTSSRSTARPTKPSGSWPIPTTAWATVSRTSRPTAYPRIVKDYPLSIARRRRQGQAGSHEAAGAGGRSGGLWRA